MIHSLTNIHDISVIDQSITENIYSFTRIQFHDQPIGSGGFGSVHQLFDIDGKQKKNYVIKIVREPIKANQTYSVIKDLHDKIISWQSQSKIPLYNEYPELAGLPFATFKAYYGVEEKAVTAFLMYDLKEIGYFDYGNLDSDSKILQNIEFQDRIYLAYQLTRCFLFLHNLDFLHCDFNEKSIFINPENIGFALIDFDSGIHLDKSNKGLTVGKISHWITGKLQRIIGSPNQHELSIKERFYEEYWIIANGLFELVFGTIPYFFISSSSHSSKIDYLSRYDWPHIDYNDSLFNNSSKEFHKTFLNIIEIIRSNGGSEFIDALKYTFNEGYLKENKRITNDAWHKLLSTFIEGTESYPIIKSFSSDKEKITKKGESVQFMIDGIRYKGATVNDILVPFGKSTVELELQDSSTVSLKLFNDFHEVTQSIQISAIHKNPEITLFEASKRIRDSKDPIIVKWNTKNATQVSISSIDEKLDPEGEIELQPTSKTAYHLTAIGSFGEKTIKTITIDTIKPKINRFAYEINIEKGIDNIDVFWETENTSEVKINPLIGKVSLQGVYSISIQKMITLTLYAEGLFETTEQQLEVHPFPKPIIQQLHLSAPRYELFSEINLPDVDFNNQMILDNYNSFIQFAEPIDLDFIENDIVVDGLHNENSLIEKYQSEKISLEDIFQLIKQKIAKKLKANSDDVH